ncbi:MAG: tRNA dihydrouridine synthase DusB [Eubacteriales bacterium]|nr:tRNA dihydrouridine synthase DusB [Eubacteriales bacterium]
MKIGNIELSNNVFMAPMAGVTDLSYRMILEEMGVGLATTEMVSAKGLFYGNKNNAVILKKSPLEGTRYKLAIQLFGSDPMIMTQMALKIQDDYDIIDINMGCPVNKIVQNGEGSALMKDPKKAFTIIDMMSRVLSKPVTVKFRKGFDERHINAVEFAKMCEEAGAAAITIHGRTREQMYSGEADWDIIRQVKEAVKIPVVGNGDIFKPEDAKRMIDETGVDAVAIARGAKGNPWLIKRTIEYLKTGELLPEPSLEEKKEMIVKHATLMTENKGEKMAMPEMRSHLAWYSAGIPGSAVLRNEMNQVSTISELLKLVDKLGTR